MRISWEITIGILCFLIGASIYLLFRDSQILVFSVLDAVGLYQPLSVLRQELSGIILPEWVLFSLPDGLWTTAYILIMNHVAKDEPLIKRMLLIFVVPFIGVTSELMQAVGLMPGVFDFADFVCYLLPFLIWLFIFTKSQNICKIRKPSFTRP